MQDKLQEVQRKYGQRIQNIEQFIQPSHEQIKKKIDISDLQNWLEKQTEQHMSRTVENIKHNFDKKMHDLKVHLGGEVQRMKEDLGSIEKKMEQKMTKANENAKTTFCSNSEQSHIPEEITIT